MDGKSTKGATIVQALNNFHWNCPRNPHHFTKVQNCFSWSPLSPPPTPPPLENWACSTLCSYPNNTKWCLAPLEVKMYLLWHFCILIIFFSSSSLIVCACVCVHACACAWVHARVCVCVCLSLSSFLSSLYNYYFLLFLLHLLCLNFPSALIIKWCMSTWTDDDVLHMN